MPYFRPFFRDSVADVVRRMATVQGLFKDWFNDPKQGSFAKGGSLLRFGFEKHGTF